MSNKLKIQVEEFNGVRNQFKIITDDGVYFQSYSSIIVFKSRKDNKIYLDKTYWNYSWTTSKHRNAFLCEETKQTEAKIKSGEYILIELN